jgi:hypothetical protein
MCVLIYISYKKHVFMYAYLSIHTSTHTGAEAIILLPEY